MRRSLKGGAAWHLRTTTGSGRQSPYKRHEIRGKPLRLPPMGRMACPGVDQESNVGNRRYDCVLIAAAKARVAIAPGHEGRRLDLSQLAGVIHIGEVMPDRSPDSGRELSALLTDSVEKDR